MTATDTQHALPAGTWHLDAGQTTVEVTAKKLGFITVPATLAVTSGAIEIDEHHQVVGVEVVVDAASYKSSNDKRDDHIRGADFLDADNHPTLVFEADRVDSSAGGHRAQGSLEVKAKTHPVTVDISSVEFASGQGSFRATATVDRKALGVAKLPSFIIGRSLELTVTARATVVEQRVR